MFKKIKLAFINFRIKLLAFRIKRRDRRIKVFEFRTNQLINKFYFLNSLRKEMKNND
jgi:hypothetical protein